jgi:hypothetical protein
MGTSLRNEQSGTPLGTFTQEQLGSIGLVGPLDSGDEFPDSDVPEVKIAAYAAALRSLVALELVTAPADELNETLVFAGALLTIAKLRHPTACLALLSSVGDETAYAFYRVGDEVLTEAVRPLGYRTFSTMSAVTAVDAMLEIFLPLVDGSPSAAPVDGEGGGVDDRRELTASDLADFLAQAHSASSIAVIEATDPGGVSAGLLQAVVDDDGVWMVGGSSEGATEGVVAIERTDLERLRTEALSLLNGWRG